MTQKTMDRLGGGAVFGVWGVRKDEGGILTLVLFSALPETQVTCLPAKNCQKFSPIRHV